MKITPVIFSRDRAAQLDLLLGSLDAWSADHQFAVPWILYRATTERHDEAYRICAIERERFYFARQETDGGIVSGVSTFLREIEGYVCFLTDDSVFYRAPTMPVHLADKVVCHSFRLGLNTTWCYPHARPQRLPDTIGSAGGNQIVWRWQGADGDFGYPGSLDGHVFRVSHLRRMLRVAPQHANPNRLEDHFNGWVATRLSTEFPLMTAEMTSSLVGIPVNRVNETHPNRYGDRHPFSASDLLERYLAGDRLELPGPEGIQGAHQELPLVFA